MIASDARHAMTEFQKAEQSVNEVEALIQSALDGNNSANVLRLSQLVGETNPIIAKLHGKALETDPVKQKYGPKMREKVLALAEKWGPIDTLARDILQQKGVEVGATVSLA